MGTKQTISSRHRAILEHVEQLLRQHHIEHGGAHTAGPWRVSEDLAPDVRAMHVSIRDASGWSVAYIPGPGRGSDHGDGTVADANARLIAQSPLMYSVLVDVKQSPAFANLPKPLRMLLLAVLNKVGS